MLMTEKQLIEKGIIKVTPYNDKYPYCFKTATAECFSTGGLKGLWIDGKYYPAINRIDGIYFEVAQ
jgi:hypothetical protein